MLVLHASLCIFYHVLVKLLLKARRCLLTFFCQICGLSNYSFECCWLQFDFCSGLLFKVLESSLSTAIAKSNQI